MLRNSLCIFLLILAGCKPAAKAPDVSGIKIELQTRRFEQDLFRMDSVQMTGQLDPLIARYPDFGENFLFTILNADPSWGADTLTGYVKGFMSAYKPVYDTVQKVFANFGPYESEIKEGLQYVRHYFPAYRLPQQLITYIGPLDGYGDILAENALVVGLHHHLGATYSMYQSELVRMTYPEYISRRFEPASISVNALKNIVSDLYPDVAENQSLIQMMIARGKSLYLLSLFLPEKEPQLLIGYTKKQWDEAIKHEAVIWDMFLKNNLLQNKDMNLLKNYIGESPRTAELGNDAPGNIGAFCGWQIVKKYMEKNPGTKPDELMKMDGETIYQNAKYKP